MAKYLHEIAVNYVYKGIKEDDYPSDDYKKTRYQICRKLIALGGYRLADWLKEAFQAEADELYPPAPNPFTDPNYGKCE